MRTVLEEVRAQHGIENLDLIGERWPIQRALQADVALITHVGYDVEAIGPFLEAFEAAAKRLCVALLLERAPGAAFAGLWKAVHGSPYAPLPALPEFLRLLEARGRPPRAAKDHRTCLGLRLVGSGDQRCPPAAVAACRVG